MRLPRFETFLSQLIDAPSQVIAATKTFHAEGMQDPPHGLVLYASTGAKLWLQTMRTSPDGGENFDAPERISEAPAALAPIAQPQLALVDGKLRLADVDAWLRALLINSGSRELVGVKLIADHPGYYHRHGLKLRFHDGATITCLWRHAVAAGARRPSAAPFEISEAI